MAATVTVTEYLYRVSLEPPARWFLCIGSGLENKPPYLNIGGLRDFVMGYLTALPDDGGFFLWLRDVAIPFAGEGWHAHHLKLAEGDHRRAIELFFERLHEWAEFARPPWFIEFNRLPRESMLQNGHGTPNSHDVRLAKHIELANAGPPPAPPLNIEGIDFSGANTLHLGMPAGFATWWTSDARRVVLTDSREATARVAQKPGSLDESRFGIAVDISHDSIAIQANGGAGVVHLRDRRLFARVSSGTTSALEPGDQLLLLSPALFAHASSLEKLPPALAQGDALTWAQVIKTAEPCICVAISSEGPRDGQ